MSGAEDRPLRLELVSGGFPPEFDAIGDYTSRLAAALVKLGVDVGVMTSLGGKERVDGVRVETVLKISDPGTLDDLAVRLRASSPDWVVVQYNPFSFGRRGFCPRLPRTLEMVRAGGCTRVAVMFHETSVPRWPARNLVMSLWQRPIFARLCRLADAIFVSTERWGAEVVAAGVRKPVHLLPVGSNVEASELEPMAARVKLRLPTGGLLLGVFGQMHVSRPLEWIAAAARQAVAVDAGARVVYIGPHGAEVKASVGGMDVIDLGALPAREVGQALRAMDVLLSPFVDGVSARRGSVVAALQNGLPVTTTQRAWTDRFLREPTRAGLMLSTARDAGEFAGDFCSWLRRAENRRPEARRELQALYAERFSWPAVARGLLAGLEAAS